MVGWREPCCDPWRRRSRVPTSGTDVALASSRQFSGEQAEGSPERFRSALKRLDWLGSSSPYLHIRLAKRAFRAKDLNRTLFELDQARAIYPTKELWMAYGAVYEQKADWVAAGDAYEKALSLSEEHPKAWLALARVQERQGEPEKARATRERAASLLPEDALVRDVLESRRRRAQDP